MMPGRQRLVDTPLGAMLLAADGGALTGAWFVDQRDCPAVGAEAAAMPCVEPSAVAAPSAGGVPGPAAGVGDPVLDQAVRELIDYFEGRRRDFSLPLAPRGTPFQRRVWDALRDVPFGALESYGSLAARCAQPAAVRAVAQAVGRNPISLFIPCHRIVGSDSALTGFGGGLPRKQALLTLEGHAYATPAPQARRVVRDARQGNLW
jgi:methylated-DNA-[protein]-cysteine S-methyltransferase